MTAGGRTALRVAAAQAESVPDDVAAAYPVGSEHRRDLRLQEMNPIARDRPASLGGRSRLELGVR